MRRDFNFIDVMVAKSKLYFVNFILPELVAKRYSSVKNVNAQSSISHQENSLSANLNQFVCCCQDPTKKDDTVTCSSSFCAIHEFHKSCTGSKRISKDWMCIFCKRESGIRKRKATSKTRQCESESPSTNTAEGVTVKENNEEVIESVESLERTAMHSEPTIPINGNCMFQYKSSYTFNQFF